MEPQPPPTEVLTFPFLSNSSRILTSQQKEKVNDGGLLGGPKVNYVKYTINLQREQARFYAGVVEQVLDDGQNIALIPDDPPPPTLGSDVTLNSYGSFSLFYAGLCTKVPD